MIELVVFDMAGTTVYDGDAVGRSFREALAGAGFAVESAAVKAVMGIYKPEAIRRLAPPGTPAAVIDAVHDDFVARMRRHYADDPSVREVPGAADAFAALRRAGVRVALNSGFSRAVVDAIVARLGWAGRVDATASSDEVPRGRPHPDMIRRLMAQLGVTDPSRVAKVGDTLVDLEEGTNAGCGLVIGVTTGAYSAAQLRAGPHTHVLDSLAEVVDVVLAAGRPG